MNGSRTRDGRSLAAPTGGHESTVSRRRLLGVLAAGGLSGVAGCVDDQENGTQDLDVDGEVWQTMVYGNIEELDLGTPSGRLGSFAFDVGFVFDPETGESEFVLAESFEETNHTVSITLREGLEWSTGDPLTGADVGRWLTMYRAGSPWMAPVPEIRDGETEPGSAWDAITDVEWDERTVTVTGEFESVESPLFFLNTYLGSRPKRYYEGYWDDFRRAYEDDPWESEETRQAVVDALEGIWDVTGRNGPDAGIHLEEEYDGEGWEAAFSGLWYPYRRDAGNLHFRVNERHPFADRVNYDEVVWTFADDPNGPLRAVQSGDVDGAMRADITETVLADIPSGFDSFPGPPETLTALAVNHGAYHLWERDVRAALQYAIDRNQLVENLNPVTDTPVSIPGADLHPDRWAPPALRETLRPYEYDRERARELLSRAGFTRDDDTWLTPEGEPFELELLTTITDSPLERSVASQLQAFGIDADYIAVEETTYQDRLDYGYFAATRDVHSNPNAAGLERIRTADIVRRPTYRDGAPQSVYLGREFDRLDDLEWDESSSESGDGHLTAEDTDVLRSLTVDAPPLGEPDGDLREWSYLYHATMVVAADDAEEKLEHARICTWIYNYQVPKLELTVQRPQIVHRTDGWHVPDAEDSVWDQTGGGLHSSGLWAALGYGRIQREADSERVAARSQL
ncbi:ABC transporter substrate-binding protein [Natronoglomus mannanivorans]|uniref:ABC transporter substrate-binding protein n=1 Tax=Natronoglomus mannanivorans TaxID=2979990 RepID=A0AAP2Z0R9_9EURY|nr:ABC transporter substrate-binding protein [Halobacteria archaeon AArc-xg1-1]